MKRSKKVESSEINKKMVKLESKKLVDDDGRISQLQMFIETNFVTNLDASSKDICRKSRNSFRDLDSSFGWYYSKSECEEEISLDEELKVVDDRVKSDQLRCFNEDENYEIRHVTPLDVADLFQKKESLHNYQLVDARYPYEYEAGHICGSINLWTLKQAIIHLFLPTSKDLGSVERSFTSLDNVVDKVFHSSSLSAYQQLKTFIFYCEYSSVRAPNLTNCIRNLDRLANLHQYPKLYVRNIWILDGGYRAFYSNYKSLCSPEGYVPMIIEIGDELNEGQMKDYIKCDEEVKDQNLSWSKIYLSKWHNTLTQ